MPTRESQSSSSSDSLQHIERFDEMGSRSECAKGLMFIRHHIVRGRQNATNQTVLALYAWMSSNVAVFGGGRPMYILKGILVNIKMTQSALSARSIPVTYIGRSNAEC